MEYRVNNIYQLDLMVMKSYNHLQNKKNINIKKNKFKQNIDKSFKTYLDAAIYKTR